MRVLEINVVCGIRSTGKICAELAFLLQSRGDEALVAYGRETVPQEYQALSHPVTNAADVRLHALLSRLSDRAGFYSTKKTEELVKWIKEYNPDIIHLHNLHGYYLNLEVLFRYLRESGKPVLCTLHDCWLFTGHCAHYDYYGCEKWKTGCGDCQYRGAYPKALVSRSAENYERKKRLFTGIKNLRLIAPSQWVANQAKESFLKDYPIDVLPSGIDTELFYRRESAFRDKYGLRDKFVVLGVASFWTKEKGIEDINRLAEELPRDTFQVVTIGQQKKPGTLSDKVLAVDATDRAETLCELYSAADLFVNPTWLETQGLTTIEALACGTPAVVYRSGGAAECVDESCGVVLERGDYEGLKRTVLAAAAGQFSFTRDTCRAKAEAYDKHRCYAAILNLYDGLYRLRQGGTGQNG